MISAEELNGLIRGFDRLYGLRLVEVGEEEVTGEVEVREELLQPFGLVHGGVMASIAESLASLGTGLAVYPQGLTAVGLSNSTSFLRPITAGKINGRALRLHRGRSTWVWDVQISDDEGRLCAITRMTIAVRLLRPGAPGSAPPGEGPGGAPAPGAVPPGATPPDQPRPEGA